MTDLKIDAQKVMTALELCSKEGQFVDCTDCPYEGSEKPVCINSLMRDALAMLKAQEPVKPKFIDTSNSKLYHSNMFQNYCCGNCGEFLHIMSRNDLFCSQCGRAVKWDG